MSRAKLVTLCQLLTCCKYSTPSWQSIMRKVTWRRFDQSAKQLVVGQTTNSYDMWQTYAPSCDMFNLGSSYFHVALTTVRHLLNVNRHAHHNTPLIYQEKNDNSTRCKSKPDCSQPGYFPSRMLTIVNWSLVDSPASSAALAVLVPQQIPPCRWKIFPERGVVRVTWAISTMWT